MKNYTLMDSTTKSRRGRGGGDGIIRDHNLKLIINHYLTLNITSSDKVRDTK